MTEFILVTYDGEDWDTRDSGPLFAATLAAKIADEGAEVTFVDGSCFAEGLGHLGLKPRQLKGTDSTSHSILWQGVKDNLLLSRGMMNGSFGDLGGEVNCIHVETDIPRSLVPHGKKYPAGRSRTQITKLFRLLEGASDTEVVVVLAQDQTHLWRVAFSFAQCVLAVTNSHDSAGVYQNNTLYKHSTRNSGFIVAPVFYGSSPRAEHWKGKYESNSSKQLILSQSWNDAILNELAKGFALDRGWASILNGSRDSAFAVRDHFIDRKNEAGKGEVAKPKKSGMDRFIYNAVIPLVGASPVLGIGSLIGLDALATGGVTAGAFGLTWLIARSKWKRGTKEEPLAIEGDKKTKADDSYATMWDELETRRSSVVESWTAYELDANLVLRFPAMMDSSVPATAAFHKAMGKVDMLSSSKDTSKSPVDTPYFDAVQEMELAFKVAEENARKLGRTVWTAEQRPKIDKAEQLLALAMDENASTNERQGAYRQALVTLEGVTALPQKATHRIEAAIALIEA